MILAKRGDTIQWEFKGEQYSAKVAMIDEEEKVYGVYCSYGQDLIPFNKAEIIGYE